MGMIVTVVLVMTFVEGERGCRLNERKRSYVFHILARKERVDPAFVLTAYTNEKITGFDLYHILGRRVIRMAVLTGFKKQSDVDIV